MNAATPLPHPDRAAPTLAVRERLSPVAPHESVQLPGVGSADARMDIKLLLHAARRALAQRGTPEAHARFATVDSPDLLAGTVQDGTARGVAVALEEVISLCGDAAAELPLPEEGLLDERALRRQREFVIAAGPARVRFSRKRGVLFVDRKQDVHAEDCVRFEDQSDHGDLDGFLADPDERPRLFSPAFLRATRYARGDDGSHLVLEGRLGRRPAGFRARVEFLARPDGDRVHMRVAVENSADDHRLRLRWLGCTNPCGIETSGAPPAESIVTRGHRFVATTIIRACGRLRVGDEIVRTPGAQVRGWVVHHFELGGKPWRTPD